MSTEPFMAAPIPAPLASDDDDVAWALQTAAVQWKRGLHADAIVWLRRAVDAAHQIGNRERALELDRAVAALTEHMLAAHTGAPAAGRASIDIEFDDAPPRPPPPRRPLPGPVSANPFLSPAPRAGDAFPTAPPEEDRTLAEPMSLDAEEIEEIEPEPIDEIEPAVAELPRFPIPRDAALPRIPEPHPSTPVEELPRYAAEPEGEQLPRFPMPSEDVEPAPYFPSYDEDSEPYASERIARAIEAQNPIAPYAPEQFEPPLGYDRDSAPPFPAPELEPARQPGSFPDMVAESELLTSAPPLAEAERYDTRPAPISTPIPRVITPAPAPPPTPLPPHAATPAPPTPVPPSAPPIGAPPAGDAEPEIAGVHLADVLGLQDLPPDAQLVLAIGARRERLQPDEEVGAFAVALVLDGSVALMPTIADVACARAGRGHVVFTHGTLEDSIALRVVASESGAEVAVWDRAQWTAATSDCPWVADELSVVADRFQALAGAAMGALGDRFDESMRAAVTDRCEVRALLPGDVLVEAGSPVPGMHIVGGGRIELVDASGEVLDELGPGDFAFAPQVLAGGQATHTARAAASGALVLFADRMTAHELMVSVPPLIEVLAG